MRRANQAKRPYPVAELEGSVLIVLLTRGAVATVDKADAWVLDHTWHLNAQGYAARTVSRRSPDYPRKILMHREIAERAGLGLEEGLEIDHANRDRLDNRRANLRVCTRSENRANHGGPRSASGYIGVRRVYRSDGSEGSWRATIRCNGKERRRQGFSTAREAALWYDLMALRLFGEFAVLNFPRGASREASSEGGQRNGEKQVARRADTRRRRGAKRPTEA